MDSVGLDDCPMDNRDLQPFQNEAIQLTNVDSVLSIDNLDCLELEQSERGQLCL